MRDRRRYAGVIGKRVSYVETFSEDGDSFVAVRFTDDTALTLVITPQIPKIQSAHLTKRKDGEISVVRTYVKSRAGE